MTTLITRNTKKAKKTIKTNGHLKNGNGHLTNGNGHSLKTISNKDFVFDSPQNPTILDGIRKDVFLDRYSLKDEDGASLEEHPEQMWKRVAWGISQQEKPNNRKYWQDKFYESLEGFKFIPAGRILSGAGTPYQVTYYNCYVIPSPKDSRGGIMENITMSVEIQARGGGVGINLSSLRPRGARVKKVNGTSSGPVNWASLYSTANHDVIQQGGSRRGALMLMINDWHPDIEEFITVKQDLSKIPGANLSVCVSDAFMEAVEKDLDWELSFPDTTFYKYDEEWDGDFEKWKEKKYPFKIYQTVKAKYLWDLIAEAAWKSAEPGVVFIDRYNKLSNTRYFEKIIATNPCITGDTLVSTDNGLVRIKELAEEGKTNVLVDSRLGDKSFYKAKVFKTGTKPVYKLTTSEGYEVKLTKDHKLLTNKGWKEAGELKAGSKILISNRVGSFGLGGTEEEGQILGWLVGDGTMKASQAVLSFFGKEKSQLAPKFAQMVNSLTAGMQINSRNYTVGVGWVDERDEARVTSQRLWRYAFQNEIQPGDKLKVPEKVLVGSKEIQSGFLSALFTADGHVEGNSESGLSARLTSTNLPLLKDVQRMLINFGIVCKIYTNRRNEGYRQMPDGKGGYKSYLCKAYHDLSIAKENLWVFAKEIGFLVDYKNAKLLDALKEYSRGTYKEKYEATFEELVYLGKEPVYDLTEPVTHSFIANGFVSHNCGEQGLGAWGVCNLGHLNLSAFIKDGQMDYKLLEDHTATAVRFLDNVVDANYYFYEENKKAQFNIRRTGLGTLGLADTLIKLKIKYGSEESLSIIEKIYKTIRDSAYMTSTLLAKEKGSFGGYKKEKYLEGEFIKRLPSEIQNSIAKNGIRNAVILTQAPTGTISLLAGVSSGIEPVYEFSYKRNDRTGEHIVHHSLFGEWLEGHGGEDVPNYFVSASGLTPEEHVTVQAKVQQFTDSSISKTVNAPNSHTVDDVKKLYKLAYDLGCKGVTYFRDGSRTGVLSKVEEKKDVAAEQALLPRPVKVEGATYRIETPVGTSFITVNHDANGQPFEIFIAIGKAGSEIAAMAEALGRLISTTFRYGNHVSHKEHAKEIVDQLKGIGGGRSVGYGPNRIRSLPDAVAKALTLHFDLNASYASVAAESPPINGGNDPIVASDAPIQTQIPFKQGDICPGCGEATLVFEEGCKKCYSCGHSEC